MRMWSESGSSGAAENLGWSCWLYGGLVWKWDVPPKHCKFHEENDSKASTLGVITLFSDKPISCGFSLIMIWSYLAYRCFKDLFSSMFHSFRNPWDGEPYYEPILALNKSAKEQPEYLLNQVQSPFCDELNPPIKSALRWLPVLNFQVMVMVLFLVVNY
jgi:hypothetical protein